MNNGEKKVAFSAAYFVISCACLKKGGKSRRRMVDAVLERKLHWV
jgi:hypothetical protein